MQVVAPYLLWYMAGDLLKVLDVSTDDTVLPTTYGQLHPPLGIHRLKVSLLDYSVYLIT
jgi:hypothetical protein